MYQMLLGLAMMGAMFENQSLNKSHWVELTDEEREEIERVRLYVLALAEPASLGGKYLYFTSEIAVIIVE